MLRVRRLEVEPASPPPPPATRGMLRVRLHPVLVPMVAAVHVRRGHLAGGSAWAPCGGCRGMRSPPPPQARSTPSAGSPHVLVNRVDAGFEGGCAPSRAGGATDRLQQQLQPVGLRRQRRGWSAAPTYSPSNNSACPRPPAAAAGGAPVAPWLLALAVPAPLRHAPLPARSMAPPVSGRPRASASASAPLGPTDSYPLPPHSLHTCAGARLPCKRGPASLPLPSAVLI